MSPKRESGPKGEKKRKLNVSVGLLWVSVGRLVVDVGYAALLANEEDCESPNTPAALKSVRFAILP